MDVCKNIVIKLARLLKAGFTRVKLVQTSVQKTARAGLFLNNKNKFYIKTFKLAQMSAQILPM
jgi:hypothetical protein